jgi:hypothetical protein
LSNTKTSESKVQCSLIATFSWTSPDGKTHNQIDNIPIDRRRHSSVLDVQSFKAADCDTIHYLVVANVKRRLTLNKKDSTNLTSQEGQGGRG